MKQLAFTPSAEADLFDIWAYLAQRNPEAADQIEAEILAACRQIAANESLGHKRRDLTPRDLLFYTVRATYLIVFDPASDPLQILRILHGARDVSQHLGKY